MMFHDDFRRVVSEYHKKGFVLVIREREQGGASFDFARREDVLDTGKKCRLRGMTYPIYRTKAELGR